MKFNITIWFKEMYLPTKRHKKLRERYNSKEVEVEIKEVTDFPVAFIVRDTIHVCEGGVTQEDFEKYCPSRPFDKEIRTYNKKLYKPVMYTNGLCISTLFEPVESVVARIQPQKPTQFSKDEFTNDSILKSTTEQYEYEYIKAYFSDYVLYKGNVWKRCEEPMYFIRTFGPNDINGYSILRISEGYLCGVPAGNFFNALQYEEAIAYKDEVAKYRGNMNCIGVGKERHIEVLMPEMVKKNPPYDYDKGGLFGSFDDAPYLSLRK